MKISSIVLLTLAIYFIFLWDSKTTLTTRTATYTVTYNGLLWVALDYYSIVKYNSSDKVICWINISKK